MSDGAKLDEFAHAAREHLIIRPPTNLGEPNERTSPPHSDRIVANERRQRPDMTDEEAKALHDRVTAPWHPATKAQEGRWRRPLISQRRTPC